MAEKIENQKSGKEETIYEKKWYIIHTYSGYEKKVATDLKKKSWKKKEEKL